MKVEIRGAYLHLQFEKNHLIKRLFACFYLIPFHGSKVLTNMVADFQDPSATQDDLNSSNLPSSASSTLNLRSAKPQVQSQNHSQFRPISSRIEGTYNVTRSRIRSRSQGDKGEVQYEVDLRSAEGTTRHLVPADHILNYVLRRELERFEHAEFKLEKERELQESEAHSQQSRRNSQRYLLKHAWKAARAEQQEGAIKSHLGGNLPRFNLRRVRHNGQSHDPPPTSTQVTSEDPSDDELILTEQITADSSNGNFPDPLQHEVVTTAILPTSPTSHGPVQKSAIPSSFVENSPDSKASASNKRTHSPDDAPKNHVDDFHSINRAEAREPVKQISYYFSARDRATQPSATSKQVKTSPEYQRQPSPFSFARFLSSPKAPALTQSPPTECNKKRQGLFQSSPFRPKRHKGTPVPPSPPKKASPSESVRNQEGYYRIDGIAQHRDRIEEGTLVREYLVKWTGYPEEENTWLRANRRGRQSETMARWAKRMQMSLVGRRSRLCLTWVHSRRDFIRGRDLSISLLTTTAMALLTVECFTHVLCSYCDTVHREEIVNLWIGMSRSRVSKTIVVSTLDELRVC